ncbi:MAG: helix-turn-helix transcriptional regulator [Haloarculaceae archaeon]
MSRPLSLALVCVLLVGTALAQGGVAAAPDRTAPASAQEQFARTTVVIQVYANGSARWTFNYYTPSLNDTQQRQFREFATQFESNETDLWRNFKGRARALTAAGANATGRNMTATNFHREATLTTASVGHRGVVRMAFTWSNFGQVDGDRIVVADVFDGVFYVGPQQWLVFETGPNVSFVPSAVSPQPDDYSNPAGIGESDSITWYGERQFPDNRPRVVFTTADGAAGGGPGPGGTPDGPTSAGVGPGMMLLGALVVVLLLGGVGYAWHTGALDRLWSPDGDADPDLEPVGSPGDGPAEAAGGAAAATTGEAENSEEPPVADEELLTDEDRVISLLEDNGGRMKQATIVEETDWSKSKVSMLLSDMEEDEQISKLRVGRENIISLAGHEPDAAGSPFDDE